MVGASTETWGESWKVG